MVKGKLSVLSVHKKARMALKGKGMAFALSCFCLIFFFAILGIAALFEGIFFTLSSYTPLQNGIAYALATAFSLLVSIFLLSPLVRGLHALTLGHLLHGRVEYGALFSFYTAKKRYFYAVRVAFSSLVRITVFALLFIVILRLGRTLADELIVSGDAPRAVLLLSLTVLFSVLSLLMLWVFSSAHFAMDAVFLSTPLLSYRQVKAVAKYALRGCLGTILKHQIIFAFYLFTSLLCLGIPLFFVLPYRFMAKDLLGIELLRK